MRQVLIAAGCLMAAMPLGWIAANTASSPAKGKEPRFPQLTLEQLNDQQRPVAEKIVKISSVGLGGPYNPMLRSPVYAQRMYDLLDYLRWHTSVPTKLNEMAKPCVQGRAALAILCVACGADGAQARRRIDRPRPRLRDRKSDYARGRDASGGSGSKPRRFLTDNFGTYLTSRNTTGLRPLGGNTSRCRATTGSAAGHSRT